MGLVDAATHIRRCGRRGVGEVVEDRHQVAVVEPSGAARRPPSAVSTARRRRTCAELDGLVHLRRTRARRWRAASTSHRLAPSPSSRKSISASVRGRGLGDPQHRPAVGVVRVVLVDDPRDCPGVESRCRAISAEPAAGAGDDHQLVADDPAPHPAARVPGRGGVAHRPEPTVWSSPTSRSSPSASACGSAGSTCRLARSPHQPLDRWRAGLPVRRGR